MDQWELPTPQGKLLAPAHGETQSPSSRLTPELGSQHCLCRPRTGLLSGNADGYASHGGKADPAPLRGFFRLIPVTDSD